MFSEYLGTGMLVAAQPEHGVANLISRSPRFDVLNGGAHFPTLIAWLEIVGKDS